MQLIKNMTSDLLIVLYGSTGDLSFRKLLTAINSLQINNSLPINTKVLAIGRRDFDTLGYLEFVKGNNPLINIELLENILVYHKMQITEETDYIILKEVIDSLTNSETRIIHYLSVAPEYMLDVSNYISNNNIVTKGNINQSLIFEKPFGSSEQSSHLINQKLWEKFSESQIYRIDHYMGKQIINDLVEIRFKNSLFNSLINSKEITNIDIVVNEEVGILNRGSFYDNTGASKDMLQSHILQILTLVLMDRPKDLSTKSITEQKVKVLKKIKFNKKTVKFGQYNGYLNENNIPDNSLTETLVSVDFKINNKYKDVTVNVLTGKKMEKKETYIKYRFKDNSTLVLNVYPIVSIEMKSDILNKDLFFNHLIDDTYDEYARLLLEAINHKKELFVRWDEIEQSWRIVDSILSNKKELIIYTNNLK